MASCVSTRRARTTTERRGEPPPPRHAGRRSAHREEDRGDPAFHRAAAALLRGDTRQAHGGARHRPSFHLCLRSPSSATANMSGSRRSASSRGQGPARHGFPGELLLALCRVRFHGRARRRPRPHLEPRGRLEGGAAALLGGFLGRDGTKDLRVSEVLDALNDIMGPHIFPAKADGSNPRLCPNCDTGQLSLKLGKFGAFIGCSNYPECKYTRQLSAPGAGEGDAAASAGRRACGSSASTPCPASSRCGTDASAPTCSLEPRGREAQAPDDPQGHAARRSASSLAWHCCRCHARWRTIPNRRADPGQYRPLRTLCSARQDLRQPRQGGRRAGDRREPRHRPDRRQGEGAGRWAPGRRRQADRRSPGSGAISCQAGKYGPYVSTARSTPRCRRP